MNKIQNEQWVNALPNEAVKVAEEINIEIAKIIAERIKEIGELSPSDAHKLTNSLQYMGADFGKITKLIAKYSKQGQMAVVDTLEKAADSNDEFAQVFYSGKGIAAYTWRNDNYLHRLVEAIARQTADEFTNLSQTLAYKIDDRTLPLRQMYTQSIDKAIYQVQSGTIDYHTAMRKTVKQLSNNMRVVKWESGYTRRLDSHVRQNILDGVKQLNQQMLDYHGEKFGSDGVELSAHAISAPDHVKVQGRQFSNEQFYRMQHGFTTEDVKGNKYDGFVRPISQWNCRHIKFPIVIGISEPAYTEEQLKDFEHNSKAKYKLTQQQRAMEAKLRKLKNERLTASAAGDEIEAKRIQREINKQQTIYRQFSEKHNLLYDNKRASVSGYRRISAKLPSVSEKNEHNITEITSNSINSIKNLSIKSYSEEQCEIIYNKHKELLNFARNNNQSKECAFIFNNDFTTQVKEIGTDTELEFQSKESQILLSFGNKIFVMHNHPRNSSFSDRDVIFFLSNNAVKSISIVKNNGGVEVLTKTDKFDIIFLKKIFRRAFKNNIKQNTDFEINKAIKEFLIKSKEMIEWTK